MMTKNRTQTNQTLHELPSVHQPEVLHESLLDDPAPLAALPQDGTVTYSKGKSKRGAEQLISSDGFSYNIMRCNKNGDIKWQCVVRNSKVKCYAQVTESGDSFVVGSQPHLHPADPGAIQKNTMRTQGKEDAIANPYKSGLQIAKDLQNHQTTQPLLRALL